MCGFRWETGTIYKQLVRLLLNLVRVGREGEGFRIAMAGLDGGRLSIASCSLGAAQACFDIALHHVKVIK